MSKTIRNFLRGVGSVLELLPPPHESNVGAEFLSRTDAEALGGDWERVGEDLRRSMALEMNGSDDVEQKQETEE